MGNLPSGTVTFLFTDIVGSTKLAQEYESLWESSRQRHHAIVQSAVEAHTGYVFQIIGDAFCAAFHTAVDGLKAALDAQRKLQTEIGGVVPVKVRMGLHTGAAELRGQDYYGYLTMVRVQRVMSTAHGGQILLSNASAELIRGELPDGVGLRDMQENRLKGLINPEHLWQVVVEDLPQDFPPLETLNSIPNNLPLQLTSFVGREKEINEVKGQLDDHRLVTLTGSGGTGKTRLSLQVAAEVLDRYPDGVWFIELAPLHDPDLIPQSILAVLRYGEQAGKTALQVLEEQLQNKKMLLILDNCEHVIMASANLANALLMYAPGIRILASSREALGVQGEVAWRVPSLGLPDPKALPGMEQLTQYEAVRLFIERASLVQPHFKVDQTNAPAIAQICYRLDGIPLAIELAAARVKALSVEQIAKRLDDRFHLLTGGSRTALPRQQTLRALIDWSYNLLSEKEKTLFRRLAVFVGGWTLEAAEGVCTDQDLETYEVVDLLINLVDKSLVFTEENAGSVRYRRLETIRQYSREKFLDAGEAKSVRTRHSNWFLQYAETASFELDGKDSKLWLDQLEAEHDNLRAALEWLLATDPDAALHLAAVLGRFWNMRDYFTEGRKALRRALQASRNASAEWRASALRWEGLLSINQGEYEMAKQRLREGLELAREAGDQDTLASTLNGLGIVVWYQGDYAQARQYYEDGLAIRRALGNKNRIATVLSNLGSVATAQGDHAAARRFLQESVDTFRELEDRDGLSHTLNNLGVAIEALGDYEAAYHCYIEGLQMAQDMGSKYSVAYTANSLAHLMLLKGDFASSQRYYRQSLAIFKEIREKRGLAYCFEGLAMVEVACESAERATRLLASAEALRESIGAPLSAGERVEYEQTVNNARAQLAGDVFAAAWAQGRAMTMEQASAYALDNQNL